MLILVGVTVTVSLNGGLFEKAREGAKGTTIARVKEQIIGDITAKIADKLGENITEDELETIAKNYGEIEENDGIKYLVLENSGYKVPLSEIWEAKKVKTLASMYCSEEGCKVEGHLHKGDYVKYNPTLTTQQYDPDKGKEAGTYTGYTQNTQSIKYEELNWRVMGQDKNGNILLISGAPTTETLLFYGYVGYNNYDTVLKETCENLYSNTTLNATARNINPEDIITYLGGFKSEEVYYNKEDINSVVEYKDDKLTVKDTIIKAGELKSTSYAYEINEKVTDELNLELLGGKEFATKPYYYWISSKGVMINDDGDYAAWSPAINMAGTIVINGGIFFIDNEGSSYDFNNTWCLRPVVTLPSSTATEDVPKISNDVNELWDDPLGLME